MVQSAQKQGLKITVEAYPYGAASTGIGAAMLAPENLPRTGMTYESIEYQGRRLSASRPSASCAQRTPVRSSSCTS